VKYAIATARRLLVCRRGSVLIGYTSLMLLFAIAAIAMLAHTGGRNQRTQSALGLQSTHDI